jgi:molybdopterin synthase catalytic subunit
VLRDGDEVGLLPPVSGGTARMADKSGESPDSQPIVIALTQECIDTEKLLADAKRGEDGAVVVFDGIVRNNTRGRQTHHLDYEAYEEMAEKQMRALAEGARNRFAVRHVTIVHRLGRLEVGETSVLIVVASAHRAAAFEASRWVIDTLKKTVPIWKKETFADGVVWADGEPFPAEFALDPEGAHEE